MLAAAALTAAAVVWIASGDGAAPQSSAERPLADEPVDAGEAAPPAAAVDGPDTETGGSALDGAAPDDAAPDDAAPDDAAPDSSSGDAQPVEVPVAADSSSDRPDSADLGGGPPTPADEAGDTTELAEPDDGAPVVDADADAPGASDAGSSDAHASGDDGSAPQPQSRAAFRDGQVVLFGSVPSREVADEIFDLAASLLGPENVIDQYVIDPSVPAPTTGNLTVEETIEFTSGAAVLPDPVPVILPIGVALMNAQPTATLRLIGHTDARGSEEANLELSLERAEAVKTYFVDAGIDPDRIEAVGAGESQPVASNDTDEGRRENRRIEFEVSNILGDE